MPSRKTPKPILPRVKTTTLADGRIGVTGDTFPIKDRLKAAGARWNAADKVWHLPAGTDLAFLKDPLPPPPPEWELQGLCCENARWYGTQKNEIFCHAHALKPWWFCCMDARLVSKRDQSCSCAAHGTPMSNFRVRGAIYTGD